MPEQIQNLKNQLIKLAKPYYSEDDPSHDFQHILRVLKNAEKLTGIEGGDLEIIIPAVLFHDAVNYPKNDPRSPNSTEESAIEARNVLEKVDGYPKDKIEKVAYAVSICSFTKGIKSETLEGQILQDADMLESVGVISIMRTFASAGQMHQGLFNYDDPFYDSTEFTVKKSGLDLFFNRLLKVSERMNTETGKSIAVKRTEILNTFLDQLRIELNQSDFDN